MEKKLKDVMHKTIVRIFEEAGYIFIDNESIDLYKNSDPEACVAVDFKGKFCGSLHLSVFGNNFLSTLTTNMLGEEDLPTDNQKIDALGEIANMICGNLLPEIISPKEIFYLDSPKKIKDEKYFHLKKQAIANVCVNVGFENGFVKADLFFDKGK